MKKELPAVQKAFDLAKELLPRVAKYPRDYRFTLGNRIIEHSLDILSLMVEAAYSSRKVPILDRANLRLEQMRFMLRLSCELGPLSFKGYEHVMKIVDDLGRQAGGWRRQASGKVAEEVQKHLSGNH